MSAALPARAALLACSLAVLPACALSGRSFEDADAAAEAPGRGSAACRRWQDEFCSYAADRCNLISREACDLQNKGVYCKDDAPLARCAEEFAAAECGAPPFGCEVLDIADRKQAAESCELFFDRMCASNMRCGVFASIEECLATPPFAIDCDRAVAISLDLEPCLQALDWRRCDQDVPVCDGVVRIH